MAIRPFLAVTPAEIHQIGYFPEKTAWMACHFSPYGTGLSNLPKQLPPGSLLVLDDITPIHGHDPVRIAEELSQCTGEFCLSGVLLDFQRPDSPETVCLAAHLSKALSCPVAVSDCYAAGLDIPVFLSPVPTFTSVQEHLQPWKGREIWLDISSCEETLRLSESGCISAVQPYGSVHPGGFYDETLHCHYQIQVTEDSAEFTLWRTARDLAAFLEDAEKSGVKNAVGLFQELQGLLP